MKIQSKFKNWFYRNRIILSVLIIAITWKTIWLIAKAFPFNSDEAIVGLMAKHILKGELPIFFYGQSYMGSFDAYLVAFGFLLFGINVWVIRLVQTLLYCFTIVIVLKIVQSVFHDEKVELFTGLYLAVPTVNVFLYTTVSLGGYGEAILFGSLAILLSIKLNEKLISVKLSKIWSLFGYLGLGLIIGVGTWANALSLVFFIPILILIVAKSFREKNRGKFWQLLIIVLGILIGLIPLWIYISSNGIGRIINEFFGSAVAVETGSWNIQIITHLRNFILFGIPVVFGIRPPWGIIWLVIPLIPFILIFWTFALVFLRFVITKKSEETNLLFILIGSCLTLIFGFIFTSFGVDPSGRYFVPLAIPLSIIFSIVVVRKIKKRIFQWLIIGIIIVFDIISTIQCGVKPIPAFTTQFYEPSVIDHNYDSELIKFLRETNERYGYSNYWVTYPIAFLSNEEIIFLPKLPYHLDLSYTSRDDRYEKYDSIVSEAEKSAFITTRNPELDALVRQRLILIDVKWDEKLIGDYRVYYNLTKKVSPEEIGIIFH
jgi:4-amino-4-deoxy-L-arabinose transferase-like glycosyltransferase